jgi:hypothetical protein
MRGSDKVNPGRYKNRGEAPVSAKAIGKAPIGLSADVRKAWYRIVKDCPEGILRQADRMAVERCAKQWVICESDDAQNQDRVLLLRFLGQFGMTPMDRNKIELPAPVKKNPFDDDEPIIRDTRPEGSSGMFAQGRMLTNAELEIHQAGGKLPSLEE